MLKPRLIICSKQHLLILWKSDTLKYIWMCTKVNDVFVCEPDARDHYSWVSFSIFLCAPVSFDCVIFLILHFSAHTFLVLDLLQPSGKTEWWSVIKVEWWSMAASRRAAPHKYEMWGLLRAQLYADCGRCIQVSRVSYIEIVLLVWQILQNCYNCP